MDRAGIQDLYAFLDFAWRQIDDTVAGAGEAVFARPVPGSGWPALRDCLAHVVFGYDRWLGIMTSRPMSRAADGIATLSDVSAARRVARAEVDALLGGLNDEELLVVRDFEIDGEAVPYSYAELLTHLALHERGHHGDVTTLFYQLGIGDEKPLEYRFHLERQPQG